MIFGSLKNVCLVQHIIPSDFLMLQAQIIFLVASMYFQYIYVNLSVHYSVIQNSTRDRNLIFGNSLNSLSNGPN